MNRYHAHFVSLIAFTASSFAENDFNATHRFIFYADSREPEVRS